MKRGVQLWYKCIQLDFIIMIKSIQTVGCCDIVDTRMTGSHRERLPLTEDIKAYPVFQPTTGVGDIKPKMPFWWCQGLVWHCQQQDRHQDTCENAFDKKRAKRQTNCKIHLADIALVVLVQPALLTVPILQHAPTHPDTRYYWYWILI